MKHFMNCFKDLAKERNELVMRHARGRILDIGCGKENYITRHRFGAYGIDKGDIFPSCNLFDTVAMVASFNYMTRAEQNAYLESIYKVLAPGGLLIITCITPLGSFLKRLTHKDDEVEHGISAKEICYRVFKHYFFIKTIKSFNFGLNNLLVFIK